MCRIIGVLEQPYVMKVCSGRLLVVGIIIDADWSTAILGLVLFGGDGFLAAMLDFDFENIFSLRVFVGFNKGFFSADQEKCCVLLSN
jgi:hypothetical protein